jgi:hypothetical protein
MLVNLAVHLAFAKARAMAPLHRVREQGPQRPLPLVGTVPLRLSRIRLPLRAGRFLDDLAPFGGVQVVPYLRDMLQVIAV